MSMLLALAPDGAAVHIDKYEQSMKGALQCKSCNGKVIAKRGAIQCHHYAHASRDHCDEWRRGYTMTEWHRWWQDRCQTHCVEVRIAKDNVWHIADVVTANGVVIELQHSFISTSNIEQREAFYGRMLWIVDGRGGTKIELLGDNFAIISGLPGFVYQMTKDVFVDTECGILRLLERARVSKHSGQCRWLAERTQHFMKDHFAGIADWEDMTNTYATKTCMGAAEIIINATLDDQRNIVIGDLHGIFIMKANLKRWRCFKWIVGRSAELQQQARNIEMDRKREAQLLAMQQEERKRAALRQAELEKQRDEWRKWWQDRCHADHVEVRIAKSGTWHVADIVTTDGTVVELLDSGMNAVEMLQREGLYDKMLWIVDGRSTTQIELLGNNFGIVSCLPEFVHLMTKDVFVDTRCGMLRLLERKAGQCRWLAQREHSFVKDHFDGISDWQDMNDAYASKTCMAAAGTRINATLTGSGSIFIVDCQGIYIMKNNRDRWRCFTWIFGRSAVLEQQEREKALYTKWQEEAQHAALLRQAQLERGRQRSPHVTIGPMDKYLSRSRAENDE